MDKIASMKYFQKNVLPKIETTAETKKPICLSVLDIQASIDAGYMTNKNVIKCDEYTVTLGVGYKIMMIQGNKNGNYVFP